MFNSRQLLFVLVVMAIGLLGVVHDIKAQSERPPLEDLVEAIASSTDEELDYSMLYDALAQLLTDPLDLNTATRRQLDAIPFLSELQITNFLEYRAKYQKLLSLYELIGVDGFSVSDVQMLLPFVQVGDVDQSKPVSFHDVLSRGRHQVFLRSQFYVEDAKGYLANDSAFVVNPNAGYQGTKYKLYTRYKFHYKDRVFAGFTAEKDPGEAFFTKGQKQGFDFYSTHLQLKDFRHLQNLVLGDYQMRFGQGLAAWSGMGAGKSSYVLNIRKKGQGLTKYSSTDENLFLRGGGATLRFGRFDVTGFYSQKNIDANITLVDTLTGEPLVVSSLQRSGLHRTVNELADKDAISENVYGGNVTFFADNFRVGATYLAYGFGSDWMPSASSYNQFGFTGRRNSCLSIDYNAVLGHAFFFGELSRSANNSLAMLNGATFNIAPQVSLALLHRNYQRDYQAYYANGFSESNIYNEQGLYIGTEIHPYRKWAITSYVDFYRHPWLRYRVSSPSNGAEYFVQISYTANRYLSMYWRFKREFKAQDSSVDNVGEMLVVDTENMGFRYHVSYQPIRNVSFKTRVEWHGYLKAANYSSRGYLIYQDLNWSPDKWRVKAYLRYAVFDTWIVSSQVDDPSAYDARIYAYESDVLYAFSIPAYYEKGTRFYFMLKYSRGNVDFWARIAQTYYADREYIGTGLNEIEGQTKTEFKLQARMRF